MLNAGGVRVHDGLVQRWELGIFGTQVSREWWQAAPSALSSTLLHAAYFSYYLIVSVPAFYFLLPRRGGGGAALRARRDGDVRRLLPRLHLLPRRRARTTCSPARRLVHSTTPRPGWCTQTLAQGSSYGAAFPSSHVAATVAAAVAAGSASRRLGLVLLAPTVLLTVGVVYCQMHYGVDALAGLLVGVLVALAVGAVTPTEPSL